MYTSEWFNKATHDYEFNRHCIGTQLKFTFWPKRCYLSNKLLWLTHAYKQTAMWTGPGDPIFEYRWYEKNKFLIKQLTS